MYLCFGQVNLGHVHYTTSQTVLAISADIGGMISYDEGESEVTSDEENNVEAGPCQFKPMPWKNSHLQEEIAQRSKQKRTTKVEIA